MLFELAAEAERLHYMETTRGKRSRDYADLGADPEMEKGVSQVSKTHSYDERAYMLAKLPGDLVFTRGLTWSHWFDI